MNLRELLFLHAASGGGGSLVENTATGNPVAFNTNVAKPLNSVTVPLTYTQSGTGDPSPTNVRPISGVSSLFCVHAKKNIANIRGYSATNRQYEDEGIISNTYGTTISSVEPVSSLVVTQTDASADYAKDNYRNGYFIVRMDNSSVVSEKYYDVSFKITNITNNPLNASLSDIKLISAGGNIQSATEVKDDLVIFKNQVYKEHASGRYSWEIRNCGMSFTLSEFMMTPANTTDGVYEAYDGAKLDVVFPVLGKNLFDKSTGIEFTETNILVARHDGYGVPIHMKAGVTYYVYVNAGTNPNEISLRVPYQATTIYVKYTSNTGYLEYTPEEDIDVAINAYWTNGRPEEATDLMIETGSKTSYEPYNNSVYGGSLDLVSGVLTLTHQMLSTTWGAGTNSKEFTTNERRRFVFPVSCVSAGSAGTLSRSNIAPYLWEYDADSVHFYNNNLYSYMFLPIGTSDSTELQIVGKLATPITVQLTPAQVSAFVGTNTFWTNTTGNLTIKYLDKA